MYRVHKDVQFSNANNEIEVETRIIEKIVDNGQISKNSLIMFPRYNIIVHL